MDSPYDMEPPSLEWQPERPLLCDFENGGMETNGTDLHPAVEVALASQWKEIIGGDDSILIVQFYKHRDVGLGIGLEGTVDVEQDGAEVRPHHYISSITDDGPVGQDGRLQPGDELLEVNGHRLYGRHHQEVIAALKSLPRKVRLVCARPSPISEDSGDSDSAPGSDPIGRTSPLTPGQLSLHPAVATKSKSEDSLLLASPDDPGGYGKAWHSLEPLNGLALWSREPEVVEMEKGDRGLGFSVMEYEDPMKSGQAIVIVRSLVPGGMAHLDGRIVPGDRLVFVNEYNVRHATLKEAVSVLKNAPRGLITLGVTKPIRLNELKPPTYIPDTELEPASSQEIAEAAEELVDEVLNWAVEFCKDWTAFGAPLASCLRPSPMASPATSSEHLSSLSTTSSGDRLEELEVVKDTGSGSDAFLDFKETLVTSGFEDGQSTELARAESESDLEPLPVSGIEQTIHIKKYEEELGVEVTSGRPGLKGFIVRKITSGGAADRDGRLAIGDCITSVNAENLRRCSQVQAMAVLRRASLTCRGREIRVTFIPRNGEAAKRAATSPLSSTGSASSRASVSSPSSNSSQPVYSRKVPSNSLYFSSDRPPESTKASKKSRSSVSHSVQSASRKKRTSASEKKIQKQLATDRGDELREILRSESIGRKSSPTSFAQWGNERVVKIDRREGENLSVSIIGGKFSGQEKRSTGVFVRQVSESSPAFKLLFRGDRILEVNGVNLRQASHDFAVETIRCATNPISFKVQSLIDVQQKEPIGLGFDMRLPEDGLSPPRSRCSSSELQPPKLDSPDVKDLSQGGGGLTIDKSLTDPNAQSPVSIEEPKPVLEMQRQLAFSIDTSKSTEDRHSSESLEEPKPLKGDETVVDEDSKDEEEEEEHVVDASSDDDDEEEEVKPPPHAKVEKQESCDDSSDDDEDDDDEDEFGYTSKMLLRKYGDLDGSLYLLDIMRQKAGLGISLSGNTNPNLMSVFVCGIRPGSAADQDGRLIIGDELLEVNGHVLVGRSHLNAAPIIGQCRTDNVKVIIHRSPNNLTKMAVRPTPLTGDRTKPSVSEEVMELSKIIVNGKLQPTRKYTPPSSLTKEEVANSDLPNGEVPSARRASKQTGTPPDYGEIYECHLEKGEQGFGFAIMEGSFYDEPGIYVKHVTPDSNAAREGTLRKGDHLLRINGRDVADECYDEVLDCLRSITLKLHLQVGRKPVTVSKRIIEAAKEKTPAASPMLSHSKPIVPDSQTEAKKETPKKEVAPPDPPKPAEPAAKKSPTPPARAAPKDDKDLLTCPIVASQETEIMIEKNNAGLGISIVGGRDTLLGIIIVHEVYGDGAAARDGRLWAGDQILEVNGVDLRAVEHETAIQTLRASGNRVRILVFRDEKPLEEKDLYDIIVVDFVKKSGRGLGISIVGRKNDVGVYISEVVKGGTAEMDGRLRPGDQILEVNGEDMRANTQEYVATVLKSTVGKIVLTLGRLKARANSPRPERNKGDKTTPSLPRSGTGESLPSSTKY